MQIGLDAFLFDADKRESTRDGVAVGVSAKAFRLPALLLFAAPAEIPRLDLYREGLSSRMQIMRPRLPRSVEQCGLVECKG